MSAGGGEQHCTYPSQESSVGSAFIQVVQHPRGSPLDRVVEHGEAVSTLTGGVAAVGLGVDREDLLPDRTRSASPPCPPHD